MWNCLINRSSQQNFLACALRFLKNLGEGRHFACRTRRVETIRARFGVAESGAVWLTQEDLIVHSLGFLSQHPVVLRDPEQIISDMHDAYARVRLDQTIYGCSMMGPSATGDMEATLVHGAQRARSLNRVFLLR